MQMHCPEILYQLPIPTDTIDSDPEESFSETDIERLFLINHAEPRNKEQDFKGSENYNHFHTLTRQDNRPIDAHRQTDGLSTVFSTEETAVIVYHDQGSSSKKPVVRVLLIGVVRSV